MKTALNRRLFLRRAVVGATALTATRWLAVPNLLGATPPANRLKCVQIGCGGRGLGSHLSHLVKETKDVIVAIVDADEKRHEEARKLLRGQGVDPAKVQFFTDYRVMFDKIGKTIDAVCIATPNHHHALPAFMAMQLGKAVFCEKPVCHDIAEARKLRAMAAESKAPTQMGNQGHCDTGYRRLCEYVWGGVVGKITETHSWTDRANGGAGPRPASTPPPAGMKWDDWIGPAPYREYHTGLHPHDWHGWYDFGNGSLGNMGCHVLDGVFWSLKIEHPTSFEAEEIREGSDERFPTGSRLRFDVPARGDQPPVKVFWYEGFKKEVTGKTTGRNQSAKSNGQNLPPLLADLKKQYPDEEFDSNGTVYVGEKGMLYTGTYGGKMHLLPWEKNNQFLDLPKTLPRTKNVMNDFLDAVREGKKETAASFEYGTRLTEFTLLGNLAQHAGVGNKVEWDGPNMRVKNLDALNRWINRPYRQGWAA